MMQTASLGGPIKRDQLWFFGALRMWGDANVDGGRFWNKTQGTPFYTPDLNRPGDRYEWYQSYAARVTWQPYAQKQGQRLLRSRTNLPLP